LKHKLENSQSRSVLLMSRLNWSLMPSIK